MVDKTRNRCDGEKVKELRENLSMTQEILAIRSKLSQRTVQRAEQGKKVSLETLASLAATLNVTVQDIRLDNQDKKSNKDDVQTNYNAVVLKPIVSGQSLFEIIKNSYNTTISCYIEPNKENIDVLCRAIDMLESLARENNLPHSDFSVRYTLSGQLRLCVELDEKLDELIKNDIGVFAGSYTANVWMPAINHEGERIQPDKIPGANSLITIAPVDRKHITVQVDDGWTEPEPRLELNSDEEVPF